MAKGIVRKIDHLGRITLPMEFRRTFGIKAKDPIGMYTVGNVIHLTKVDEKFRGIARELDDLGRICLPIEVRRSLGYAEKQAVDIHADGDEIVIRKDDKTCRLCGADHDLIEVDGVLICQTCAYRIMAHLQETQKRGRL